MGWVGRVFLPPNFQVYPHRKLRSFVTSYRRSDELETQRFLVQNRLAAGPRPLPGGDEREFLIIANGFSISRLIFLPKMGSAGLASGQGVITHQLAECEIISDPACPFVLAVQARAARNQQITI